ncbi:MAG: hypothetical protein MJ127_01970 [Mogibacterium sp.]|nr:hypothetical protein [Mogibacterium sp.]
MLDDIINTKEIKMRRSKRLSAIVIIIAVIFTFTLGDIAAVYGTEEPKQITAVEGSVVTEETEPNSVEEATLSDEEESATECNHNWGDYIIDKTATYNKRGSKHRECSICGKIENIALDYVDTAIKLKGKDGKYHWYYYKDGKRLTGTGWIKENKIRAYYKKDGKLYSGWHTIKVKVDGKYKKCKFYFGASSDKTPRMARGYKIIKDKAYYFKNSTSSVYCGKAAGKGAIKNSSGEILYYCKGDGLLKTGWIGISGKPYYFYGSTTSFHNKGERAFNYTSPTYPRLNVGDKGYMTGSNAKLYAYAINALNKYGWSMNGAYKYSYKLHYANRPYRPTTVKEGALYGFSKGKGNCFVMNCCFHVMLEILADKNDLTEIRQVKSSVGAWKAPHSWLEVNIDGKWWIYDANFRNETGRNGFKIYYGKKGTWRYNTPAKGDAFHKIWPSSKILEKGF